jgi:hypothetical protein
MKGKPTQPKKNGTGAKHAKQKATANRIQKKAGATEARVNPTKKKIHTTGVACEIHAVEVQDLHMKEEGEAAYYRKKGRFLEGTACNLSECVDKTFGPKCKIFFCKMCEDAYVESDVICDQVTAYHPECKQLLEDTVANELSKVAGSSRVSGRKRKAKVQ